MGKPLLNATLKQSYRPPNHSIKATVTRQPDNHCRITVPNEAPSITLYNKGDIRYGYLIQKN